MHPHTLSNRGMICRRRIAALVIALAIGTACQQQSDGDRTPTTRPNVCGEPGVCEGS